MAFLVIHGKFLPKRGQPDGDSVRFTPNDSAVLGLLETKAGRKANKSTDAQGRVSVQLRYEGIDAMEKDALPGLPQEALAANKQLIGFIEGSVHEPAGYVLASGIEQNGRPIVFVYAGPTSAADGSDFFLEANHLKTSVNHELALRGLVYPMYYQTLYAELRSVLTQAVLKARSGQRGVWKDDKSNSGFSLKTRTQVQTLPPIFPKLYRRLQKSTAGTVAQLKAALAAEGEKLATLSDGRFLHFDDVIEDLGGNRLKLGYLPEDMVFV